MRVLALDLGSKRVGIAVSDPSRTIATPLEVFERLGDRRREHRHVADLVDEYEVDLVVVGLPLSLDGSTGPAARAAEEEIVQLGATLGVPVQAYDERLTTVSADRLLREAKMDARARRQVVDKVAAAVLLQSWLDGRHPATGDTPPDQSEQEIDQS